MNNNGLESTNKVFKDRSTLHERMPIIKFLPAVRKWVGTQSRRRDPGNINCVSITMHKPDILLKDMTNGYNLMKSKMRFYKVQDHSIGVTNDKIGDEPFSNELAKEVFEQYENDDYESMDQFCACTHY